MQALFRHWRKVPPVHVSARFIARALGATDEAEPSKPAELTDEAVAAIAGSGFANLGEAPADPMLDLLRSTL